MKKSGRLVCGSLSLVLCVTGSGCAGQGIKNLFVWDRTAGYKTLDEMENSSGAADSSKAVASKETPSPADEQETTWRGRLASWSPFGAKDAESGASADPFLSEKDSTDQVATVSHSQPASPGRATAGADEAASTRRSIDDAMQKSTVETEHLFADLKTKPAAAEAPAPKTTKPRSPRKAIEDLDALLATEARNRSVDEFAAEATSAGLAANELVDGEGDASEAVAMFDSNAKIRTPAAKASAFDALVSGAQALTNEVNETSDEELAAEEEAAESLITRSQRVAKAEQNFFNTLQAAKEVKNAARRDPFEAAAAVAQRMSDDTAFEWTRPSDDAETQEVASTRRAAEEKKNVFSNAAFQSVKPASDSHRLLDVPVTTVSAGTVVAEPEPAMSTSLADSSDPFFSAGTAPAAITEIPAETVAATAPETNKTGIWKSLSLRNVILVVGAIIVAFLLFAPNRKEAA